MKRLMFLLLICSISFAVESQNIEYMKVQMTFQRDITPSANVLTATFNSYDIPQGGVTEDASTDYIKMVDDYGNTYLRRVWANTDELSYSFSITMENTATTNTLKNPPKFPYSPEGFDEYLESTSYSPITEEIQNQALLIVQDSTDTFDAVSKMAYWINTNVKYDASYGSVINSADKTIEIKRGTCDEFSHLLIAMSRSVGIPARYVSGITYGLFGTEAGGSLDWYNHGWVEVYLGQWVPVDPTYGEIGYVDATHIKFAHAPDQESLQSVLSWKPHTTNINIGYLEHGVEILETRNFTRFPQRMSGGFDTEKISDTETVLLKATLSSDYCTASDVKLVYQDKDSVTPDMGLVLGAESQLVTTCSAPADVYYLFAAPSGLNPDYFYTYETIAYNLQDQVRSTIEINPTLTSSTTVSLDVDKTSVKPNENLEAAGTANLRSTTDAYLFLDSKLKSTTPIPAGSTVQRWSVKSSRSGRHELTLYVPHKYSQAMFTVSRPGSLQITIDGPSEIEAGKDYEYEVSIVGDSPDTTLRFELFKVEVLAKDLTGETSIPFTVSVPKDAPSGEKHIIVTAATASEQYDGVKKVTVKGKVKLPSIKTVVGKGTDGVPPVTIAGKIKFFFESLFEGIRSILS